MKNNFILNKIVLFRGREIRRIIYNNEWWFSVVDVCEALTDSADAGAYWRKLKQRLAEEKSEVVTFCHGLKLMTPDGKMRETDCANTEGMFRIIQLIPSPKAEPFKRWLAKVGYERVQEIENPELAMKRTRALYKLKGYNELSKKHPDNRHIKDKIRQQLQVLRDKGYLEFSSRGNYRLT